MRLLLRFHFGSKVKRRATKGGRARRFLATRRRTYPSATSRIPTSASVWTYWTFGLDLLDLQLDLLDLLDLRD